jgi:glycosyltransferase involved in cell wall biosynthesis
MNRPQVSALLPIKDGARYVNQIMSDLIACTNIDDEILVIDDHSSDETGVMLKKWAERYSRVKIITPQGKGLVNALNLGIAAAKNNWVARFDCDDRYPGNRLSIQLDKINSTLGSIFSDYEIFNSNGKSLGVIPSPISPVATRLSLWRNARTPHPSAIMNREMVLQVGGYFQEDFLAEDLSLWLRLSEVGELRTIPETLLHYTLNPKSVTGTRYQESKQIAKSIYSEKGKDLDLLRGAISNFQVQANEYRNTLHGKERILLHYTDIVANGRIMKLPILELALFFLKEFKIYFVSEAFSVAIKQLRRKFARISKPTD